MMKVSTLGRKQKKISLPLNADYESKRISWMERTVVLVATLVFKRANNKETKIKTVQTICKNVANIQ